MSETRTQRRIRLAVNEAGGEIDFMDWEPLALNGMDGDLSGGWTVCLKSGAFIMDRTADELIAAIKAGDWREELHYGHLVPITVKEVRS